MKFKDIKVGDEVYIEQCIVVGWSSKKCFWIPKKVERVTKAQFVAAGARYRKSDGRKIGDHQYAKHEGDKKGYGCFDTELISDETEQMKDLIRKLRMIGIVNDIQKKLLKIKYDHPKLESIYAALKDLEI